MPDIKDITTAASYTGNKELGGYVPDAISIDARPLELLASYTVAYNKAEYDQRQKDAEGRAKELAGMAAIDFSKIDDKWRQPIAEKFDKLTAFVKTNPSVFNYQKNPQGFLEYSRMKDELGQAVNSGKANQIILEKRNGDIKSETNVDTKQYKQNRLDEDKGKTGLYDTMPIEEQYDIKFDKLPEVGLLKTSVIYKSPNSTQTTDYTLRDMGKINQQAQAFAYKDMLDEKDVTLSDEYKKADAGKQKMMKEQQTARTIAKGKDGWSPMGQIAKDILGNPKYKDANNDISMDLLLKDPATEQLATAISSVNQQIAEQKAKIDAGLFTDKSGQALDSKAYYPINYKDGINATELARMQMWINSGAETKDSKDAFNGDQTKVKINDADNAVKLTIAREGQAGENYRKQLEESGKEGKAASKTILENGYNPMASIISSIGVPNTPVTLSTISLAQAGALNPNYLNKDGDLDLNKKVDGKYVKDIKIAYGTAKDGTVYIYEVDKEGNAFDKQNRPINKFSETKILSNASSWLGTKGKERKGQDVYAYTEDGLKTAFKDVNAKATATPVPATKRTPAQTKADEAEAKRLMEKYNKPQ